jgi:hypothetical protein
MKRPDSRLPALLAALTLPACDGSGPTIPFPVHHDLALAVEQWEEQGVPSYSMTVELHCFCLPPVGTPVRVTVRDEVVVSAVNLETGEELPPERWFTVTTLLERLQKAEAQADLREARFGPHGLPIYAYTGELANDSGVVYRISDFAPE